MSLRVFSALLFVTSILASCSVGPVPPPSRLGCGPGLATEQDGIHEAVLRELFALNRDSEPSSSRALLKYYIGVDADPEHGHYAILRDPAASLVARFGRSNPVVKPISAAPTRRGLPVSTMWDHVFVVGDVCWKGPDRVEVQAGRRPYSREESDYLVRLKKQSGSWVMSSYESSGGR